jgi:hypothetical protein
MNDRIETSLTEIWKNISEIKTDFKTHEKWEEGFLSEAFKKQDSIFQELQALRASFIERIDRQNSRNIEFVKNYENLKWYINIILILVSVSYFLIIALFLYVRAWLY